MAGRIVFTDGEKMCLQELIVKYKLHTMATSGPDSGSISRKKVAWARLTEEFNSIETNNHRTENQLKKCWDNIKSRRKQILRNEKRERMKTGGGQYDGGSQPSTSNDAAIDAVIDFAADAELQFAIDSDMNTENIVIHEDIEEEIAVILPSESERAGSRLPGSDATGQEELERTAIRHPGSIGCSTVTTQSQTDTERRRRTTNTNTSDYGTSRTEIARSTPHLITSLDVPRFADPRREVVLSCNYTRQPQDPPLHSVKWYRDTHEIFRYTPQEYETRAFNSTGVSITNSSCEHRSCIITVRPESGTAKYTCEVSSEGPRFAVDRKSTNMTLAVLPEYDPLITGLPTIVQVGEQALVNCTSDYSLPAATIEWFVDSEPQEDPVITGSTHVSGADSEGLRASWRTLHVFPDDYVTHRGYLSLRCRATVPTRPPHVRMMSVRLYVASRPHISSYMFSKNNAVASSSSHRFKIDLKFWTFVVLAMVKEVPSIVD